MISDAKTYEGNQGMPEIPDHKPPPPLQFWRGGLLALGAKLKLAKDYERARKNEVQRRKQERDRDLLASLNSLSAAFLAAVGVAERQIAILQDMHKMFSTSYPTKINNHGKSHPSRQHPFYKSATQIPVLSEYPELVWSNILDTIDETVRERKSFIKKIKELVENMDIRRKIV